MADRPAHRSGLLLVRLALVVVLPVVVLAVVFGPRRSPPPAALDMPDKSKLRYSPRIGVDLSGYFFASGAVKPWAAAAPLGEIREAWARVGYRNIDLIDQQLSAGAPDGLARIDLLLSKTLYSHYEGEAKQAYEILKQTRAYAEANDRVAEACLYTLIYAQGVTALRLGENDNCVACRGESSCILPIAPAAVHTNPHGSRTAVAHFTEYLRQFPDDLEVRWLLNVAHMTLGEHPDGVDPAYRLSLDHWRRSEFDIGKFRDIGHLVGVNRLNQAGGAVMDDFDNDGRLDLVCTTFDPAGSMVFYRNKGDGTFEDRTLKAGLGDQLGGLNLVQADYDNDGHTDLFVPRGAWLYRPMRPSLLRNNGDGTFTDVTEKAGLLDPVNSNAAAWSDFDNDGFLDLFVCCERQPNRLYRNKGDGTFEEVAERAGVRDGKTSKGCAWIDYDNDGYPDLFVNDLDGAARLYHNNRDRTFTDVTDQMGITGPKNGFSCWAFDFDNDGHLDLFATCYDRSLEDVVKGLLGRPHGRESNRLFRNLGGKGFQDVTREAGLDMVFATMGSNFGDFDNDGYLDFYLGTGEPNLATLIPNRMFKNIGGKRFAEITVPSGTGHLQKGHGVACGDWDRDGNVDIFMETGGAGYSDRYHNVLFQNPGQGNHWLTLKLVGKKTNRSAIGARIRVTTAGEHPLTVHRHVSSGSSFGGNPLQQTVGLAQAGGRVTVEVSWPTSGTTQVFRDVAADQAIEITEFAGEYRKLNWTPIPVPK